MKISLKDQRYELDRIIADRGIDRWRVDYHKASTAFVMNVKNAQDNPDLC